MNVVFLFLFGLLGGVGAGAESVNLPLKSTIEPNAEPLTTEKIWEIDPEEKNPHRRRWALDRLVELNQLKARPRGNTFRISGGLIHAQTMVYVRGKGPWFKGLEDFPCTKNPISWFATEKETIQQAMSAGKKWKETLEKHRPEIVTLLSHLSDSSSDRVLRKSRYVFRKWLEKIEKKWRIEVRSEGRKKEWATYISEAKQKKLCQGDRPTQTVHWEELMEPPPSGQSVEEIKKRVLVRAPARLWGGQFSVRLTVDFAGKKLNGKFLIDSDIEENFVSPSWMISQGLNPNLYQTSNVKKVKWNRSSDMTRSVIADRVELSGLSIPIREFWLFETSERFTPPRHIAACCDGVLGLNFLRRYAVLFDPNPSAHVKLWERRGFHLGQDTPWIEVATNKTGDLVSSCVARRDFDQTISTKDRKPATSSKEKNAIALHGALWDLGFGETLLVRQESQKPEGEEFDYWRLDCGKQTIAKKIRARYTRRKTKGRAPALHAGMGLLARGPFVLDLGHGRLWFSKGTLDAPVPDNRSGLVLDFSKSKDGRVLKVVRVEKGSFASELNDQGLRPKLMIDEINGIPADELDLWQVRRILSGTKGNIVTLQWYEKDQRKIVPLQVR